MTKEEGEMMKDRINMKTVQRICEDCLDIIEKHEDVAGSSFRAEEAIALFRHALNYHFNTGYGTRGAVQMAHSRIFKSTIETRPVKL